MDLIVQQPASAAALAVAVTAAVSDLRTRTIPNALVFAGIVAGVVLNGWWSGAGGVARALLGGLAGFAIFLPFYLLRGMGGGDVKLMAALGCCLGFVGILQTALIASMAGAVLALGAAARHGVLRRTLVNAGRLLAAWARRGIGPSSEVSLDNPAALRIPYALPIAVGALAIVLSGAGGA